MSPLVVILFLYAFKLLLFYLSGDVYIPALWQAPLLEGDEKFPVIVLSHGIGGNRTTYSAYCCELASHGFIVAAVEHRDGTASMTYLLKDNLQRTVVEVGKDREGGKHKRHHFRRSHSFKEEWRSFQHTDHLGIKWDDYDYRNKQVFFVKICVHSADDHTQNPMTLYYPLIFVHYDLQACLCNYPTSCNLELNLI